MKMCDGLAKCTVGVKVVSLLAVWLLAGIAVGGQAAAAPKERVTLRPEGVVPGQYIVTFHEAVTDPQNLASALARQHGFTLRHTYRFALKGFAARMSAGVADDLATQPNVALVEPDLFAHAFAQTLPEGVDRIDADWNTLANIDGGDDRVDVDIAIIDTGIDLDHPDLNVFKDKSFIKRVKSGNDDNGHGTHVAGIAAALDNGIGVVGVAPGARLWALKVLDRTGSGYFSDVIKAIDYVTGKAGEIEVVNMSLGGTGKLDSLRTAIQNSVAVGVVYVVAAGNSSKDVYGNDGVFGTNDDFIPASYPEVAAISAMGDTDGLAGGLGPNTSRGTADDTFADFTNFSNSVAAENPVTSSGNPVTSSGAAIDLAAPGVDIYSTWKDGGYNTISGTSMAAPHVAGAAALEAATNGRAINAEGVADIRQALIDAAEPQSAWGPANTNDPDAKPEGLANVASGPPNDAPTVSITTPADDSTFDSGATILFEGTANDTEDGDITTSVVWISSIDGQIGPIIDGQIGTGGSFEWTLSDGNHTITAEVTDSGGKSGSASSSITVGTPPPTPTLAVTVTTDKASYVHREKALITVTVQVEGAAVHVVVTTAKGNTLAGDGTTDASGVAKFQYKVNSKRDGIGTYSVDATASEDGFASGTGSTTFEVTE